MDENLLPKKETIKLFWKKFPDEEKILIHYSKLFNEFGVMNYNINGYYLSMLSGYYFLLTMDILERSRYQIAELLPKEKLFLKELPVLFATLESEIKESFYLYTLQNQRIEKLIKKSSKIIRKKFKKFNHDDNTHQSIVMGTVLEMVIDGFNFKDIINLD